MLSIQTIQGGPLSGLPSLTLVVGKNEDFPLWDDLISKIERCIPPLTHLTLRVTSERAKDAEIFSFIQDAKRLGLAVSAECFKTIPPWAAAADQTVLYTADEEERQRASIIVFMTPKPPRLWRPSPSQYPLPLLYWSSPRATLSQVLELPTTMRLWTPFDASLEENEA